MRVKPPIRAAPRVVGPVELGAHACPRRSIQPANVAVSDTFPAVAASAVLRWSDRAYTHGPCPRLSAAVWRACRDPQRGLQPAAATTYGQRSVSAPMSPAGDHVVSTAVQVKVRNADRAYYLPAIRAPSSLVTPAEVSRGAAITSGRCGVGARPPHPARRSHRPGVRTRGECVRPRVHRRPGCRA